jgi:hypothetical protein
MKDHMYMCVTLKYTILFVWGPLTKRYIHIKTVYTLKRSNQCINFLLTGKLKIIRREGVKKNHGV